jgi:hypothetical protein
MRKTAKSMRGKRMDFAVNLEVVVLLLLSWLHWRNRLAT